MQRSRQSLRQEKEKVQVEGFPRDCSRTARKVNVDNSCTHMYAHSHNVDAKLTVHVGKFLWALEKVFCGGRPKFRVNCYSV